ncbi:MAG: cation-transporting P-type ATPase [Gammaproteobacteria bacterium]|nr:cation-transporting P-type ATPase [Gammaproteobacteria bacterium]
MPSTTRPVAELTPAWHALDDARVLAELDADAHGLSTAEAQRRLQSHGANRLPVVRPRSAVARLLTQFHNVLIYVLLGSAVVTLLLQHWVDSAVIIGVVIVNALIGFVQEGRAEDALAAIRGMLSPQALVVRDGRRQTIGAEVLVPGDVVVLQAGDRVPADLRVLTAHALQVDEAALTGESMAVEKSPSPVGADALLAERCSMVYSGTLIVAGLATGVVVATGSQTELGRISTLVAHIERLDTPLLRQLAVFGHRLSAAILAIAATGFAFGMLVRGYSAADMFLAAVGIAVAAIPEGLPAIMTVTLAIGVQRMAARNAIIRRLPAVETLGTVSVICSDKTGTLTRNQMTVRTLALADTDLAVSGTGYDPHGGFSHGGSEYAIGDDDIALQALQVMCLCNDATVTRRAESWTADGDPMEAALIVAVIKAGIDPALEAQRYPRRDVIPFDAEHRFMATLHHSHDGQAFVHAKGAPEHIMRRCALQRGPDGDVPLRLGDWERRVDTLGRAGYRVIALASKGLPRHADELHFGDVDDGLVLIGLCGLIDPPRPAAIEAVATCRRAGIKVKMITGDHWVTACSIAAQVGLDNTHSVLTGADLLTMNDDDIARRVDEVDVYARVTPEHKLQLVQALQARGHVVAMTGDGVNDAPALRRADVGVAMGRGGTEVAKDSAEVVLTDDNFATIVNAVREGRTVYDNLRKAMLFILPTSGGEALVMLGAILFGFADFPLTPVQILWVNMITAATLGLALAFEPPEADIMQRPPRDPREPILTALFLWRIGFVSLVLVAGTFGLFLYDLGKGAEIAHARTLAVNTLVGFEIFYLFNARFILAPVLNRTGLGGNPYVLLAVAVLIAFQLLFTYLPTLQGLFGTTALAPGAWVAVFVVSSSVLWLVELEKFIVRRRLRETGSRTQRLK